MSTSPCQAARGPHEPIAAATLGEAAAVAAAAGHKLDEAGLDALGNLVTAAGFPLTSSLSRDLAAGRATEVENVLGDLIDRGWAAGVPVPRLEAAALTLRAHNQRQARRRDRAARRR
jgi:2-dehydropantoate 2-reductase